MKYIKQLDGLRAFAIILVLISHFATPVGQFFSAGYYGVDIFFVLSGFLITSILLNYQRHFWRSYKAFIGRRVLRIFPVYYLTILILLVFQHEYVKQYLIYCLTYTYNYAWVYFKIPENSISHFWSLCVEEQFYLFFPLIVLGFRKKLQILKLALLCVIVLSATQLYYNIFPTVSPYNGVGIFPQVYPLAIGALGAVFYKESTVPQWLYLNIWIECFAIAFLTLLLVTHYNAKYIICPVFSLFFVLKAMGKGFSFPGVNKVLNNRLIVYIGVISYGIYVFHLPLEYYFSRYLFDPLWNKINPGSSAYQWVVKLPVCSVLAFVLAHYSYKYFEKPILSLKNKYFNY